MGITLKEFIRQYGKQAVSFLLAFLMLFSAFPFSLYVSAAETDPQPPQTEPADDKSNHDLYHFKGNGTIDSPYLLSGELDFKGLADNVRYFYDEPEVNGYRGKYFRVEVGGVVTNRFLTFSQAFSIGVDGDADRCFYGSLDLNGYVLYINAPLFGALGSGAHISGGSVVLNDPEGKSVGADANWGALAVSVVTSEDKTLDNYVTLDHLNITANVDCDDKTVNAMGGAVGRIVNHTGDNKVTVEFRDVELNSHVSTVTSSGVGFRMIAAAKSLGGYVGCIDNGEAYAADATEVNVIISNAKVLGSLQNSAADGCDNAQYGHAENIHLFPDPDNGTGYGEGNGAYDFQYESKHNASERRTGPDYSTGRV